MARKLQAGDSAPHFRLPRAGGGELDAQDMAGRWWLLSFHRYATWPTCVLTVRQFAGRAQDFHRRDVGVVRIFHSPPEALAPFREGEHAVPFPVLADPRKRAYAAYGVTGSWFALFRPGAYRRVRQARREGLTPRWRDALRDGISIRPADFLIDPDGRLVRVHYGRDFTDSVPPDRALAWLDDIGTGRME